MRSNPTPTSTLRSIRAATIVLAISGFGLIANPAADVRGQHDAVPSESADEFRAPGTERELDAFESLEATFDGERIGTRCGRLDCGKCPRRLDDEPGCTCGRGCECANSQDEPWTLMEALCGDEDPPFTIGGWTEWGYSNRSDGVINTHPHRFNNHQSWLYAERIADGADGWDWGFRADILYGTDGPDTQAFGNPPGTWDYQNGWDHGIYGWAMPQLYAEAAYEDWSIIIGHFYSKQGYENFTAPSSFFFSHALTWNFSEPFTHTGFFATYQATEAAVVGAGWSAGLDTGFEQLDGGSSIHAGTIIQATDDVSLSYWFCAGNFGYRGDGYLHSVIADVMLTDRWNYVFHSDLTTTNSGGDHQFAIVNYLFYAISDCLKAGGRAEWWKTGGESFYEVTGGVNIAPHPNLTLRPEIRYQWASSAATAAELNVPINDAIFGINAVVTF